MRKTLLLFLVALCSMLRAAAADVSGIVYTNLDFTQYQANGNVGAYMMMFSTGPSGFDPDLGIPMTTDPGFTATMCLYGPASSAASVPLPDGTYTLGEGAEVGTWANMRGYNRLTHHTDAGEKLDLLPESGTLTVSHEGGETVIRGTLTAEGNSYSFEYRGQIAFQGTGATDRLEEPMDADFISGLAFYTGEESGYGVVRLELSDQVSDSEGAFPDGTSFLKAVIYVPKHDYSGPAFSSIPAGKYDISFIAGNWAAMPGYDDGESIPTGSYATLVNRSSGSRYGMIEGGSITIAEADGKYQIDVDFVTAEGVSVKGRYNDVLKFYDINDGGGTTSFSTLVDDKVLDYADIASVTASYYGDLSGQGVQQVILRWLDETSMQGTTLEFYLPADADLSEMPTGTYPVGQAGEFVPNTITPGNIIMGAFVSGSWGFQRFGYTAEGQLAVDLSEAGPAAGGDVTIAKAGDDYTVTFNLHDDKVPAYTMTGTWTGQIKMPVPAGIGVAGAARAELVANAQGVALRGLAAPADMTIYDTAGRVVASCPAWDGSPYSTAQLPTGVYLLKTGKHTYKFVK